MQRARNFHAFWCDIASWGLTSAATILQHTLDALARRLKFSDAGPWKRMIAAE
jgi:hypothetical protein